MTALHGSRDRKQGILQVPQLSCKSYSVLMEQPDKEEQYLLRVLDKPLAEKIRAMLREPPGDLGSKSPPIELRFANQEGADTEARTGKIVVEGKSYPVKRQDLPTIVECFKTYDSVNLVKSAGIGQVMIVPESGSALPDGTEARHGVTPPMKDARKRRFRKARDVNPAFMRQVEDSVLAIASGLAPEGYEFIDEEEEYIVSADGTAGSWQPYQPGRVAQTPEPNRKGAPKRRGKKKGESAEPGASQDEEQKRRKMPEALSQEDGDGVDIEDI